MNLRILLAVALTFAPLADASAAVVQIQAKDSGGTARNFNVTTNTDATGNLSWNNVICDQSAGTTCAAVKAASTAAGATDPALVVAISPNNSVAITAASLPLPTGAATLAGLTTINTTLGSPFQAGGSIGNTTFAVTNAGTFATQLTGATNNINNISGTISLPTGASAEHATTSGADGVSNTLTGQQSYSRLQMFNGTTWDRLLGDTTNGIWVNVRTATGPLIGSAVPNNGSFIAGRAQSSEATAASDGNLTGFATDLVGKAITLPYANPENLLNGEITSAMTGTTSTALTGMGAQGGSFRVYATACAFSNSHATVGTTILLQDGSGGATLWQVPAASAFGGAAVTFPTPIKTTANNGLFAVNGTTGSSTFVSCTGYKGV